MDDQRINREGGEGVTAWRFSLRRLLASLTLSGIGLAIIGSLATREYDLTPSITDIVAAIAWLGGGMIFGAGLLLPFKRAALGSALGFVVQLLILESAYLIGYYNN
jgi:hypothetical protein